MAKGANGRSSIYRDANGSWHGYISMPAGPDGRVRRRHVRGPTKAAVAAKVRKLEDQRAGGLVSGPAVTVSQWVRSWMALQEFAVRPNTLKGYRTDQRWIDRGCGHVRLERIGPGHIEAIWRVMLNAGLTSGSIVHCKRTLNAALNTAVGRGMLDRNPIRLATTPRWEPPEVTPFTADEARRVLDAARELRNSARWSVALALGLRQGEALGLRWDDVDLDIGTLKVRRQLQRRQWRHGCAARDQSPTCGTRAASCPARTGGGQELTDVKSTAGWGLVFAQVDGKPIDQKRDWLAWKALLVAAEVADARLHDARHTAATLLLVQGVPEIVAMEILGHTDLRVTRRYQHVADELLQDAADRIGAALWSP
jgi:integrase